MIKLSFLIVSGWRGVGIGGITRDIGDAEPLVCRILPDMEPMIVPMWLATHRELNTSKRVRTVFDFLVAELSRKPFGLC